MLFNSINFAIFLPIVFLLYWFAFNKKSELKKGRQNLLLLLSSYFFYACWDWRFLFLLMFSTLLDYFSAIMMSKTGKENRRKFWFCLSICINLGFLGIFKYYNFFAESFAAFGGNFGFAISPGTINVILPVGISFYTFHGLSYVIDIYKNRINCEQNFVDYAVFVSFFPLLVAGPIERATHLLPQIKKERFFDYSSAVDGLRQILWGLFKKIVIADNCAEYANIIFHDANAMFINPITDFSGSTHVLGAIFFALQIYGDFSGYSDIAIGTAKLFGIKLLRNFAFPYFSRDIAEFWRRWHISLTSWFRDYLYIPLGGSKKTTTATIRNTLIIFLVSGFWHGANWTFVAWGALNAIYIMPSIVLKKHRKNLDIVAQNRKFPTLKEFFSMFFTFGLATLAWIFFRAESLSAAASYIAKIFSKSLFSVPQFMEISSLSPSLSTLAKLLIILVFIIFFFAVEWAGRREQHALAVLGKTWKKPVRICFYYMLVIIMFLFAGSQQQFIYFQF